MTKTAFIEELLADANDSREEEGIVKKCGLPLLRRLPDSDVLFHPVVDDMIDAEIARKELV